MFPGREARVAQGRGKRGGRGAVFVGAVLAAGCGLLPGRPAGPPADPLAGEERNDLGAAYHARGEYGRAVREFRQALVLHPGWVVALRNLGDAHLAAGEVEEAIAAYETALRADPDEPTVANNLAWALLQHPQRWGEAEGIIRRALARDPEPRGYYLDTLGLLLLRKGEPREALQAFRTALADPELRNGATRALVLRHAGTALDRLDDHAAAERCHRAAAELEQGHGARPGNAIGGENAVC